MIKQYFKQAWTMMRQNRLFTSIYIAGTGLSIAFTMVLFIIYYVKFAPIYPEYNRDRMLVINSMAIAKKGASKWNHASRGVNLRIAELVKGLPSLDKMAFAQISKDKWESNSITMPVTGEELAIKDGRVDAGFWQVFNFRFLAGKPFDEAMVEAGQSVAILSEHLAEMMFASTDVVGKRVLFNGNELQVIGVVSSASSVASATAADIYLPLHYNNEHRPNVNDRALMGGLSLYMTAKPEAELTTLRQEVVDVLNRYNLADTEWETFLMDLPDVWWKNTFRTSLTASPDIASILRGLLYMVLALLFIPAMNLCGMISSRMNERMCELGVRKAYGATNTGLISQILTENLLLTFLGGILGLALAYLIALSGGEWVLFIFEKSMGSGGLEPSLTLEMLFNPTVFGVVFCLCLLLNLISALVPTILALRHSIIYCIHTKR